MSHVDLIYRILSIIIPVFCIVLVGYSYSRKFNINMATSNQINIDIFVPMLIFGTMSSGNFSLENFHELAIAGLLVVLGSGLIAWPIGRIMNYQWKTFLPPMMFSNTGNMGLPLIVLAFGEQALPAAIILFVIENFLHFSVGQQMINRYWSFLFLLKNPMIIATLLGIAVSELDLTVPEVVLLPVNLLGQISIPLMLFSLGVRLTTIDFKDWRIGLAGAVVCPLTGLLIALLLIVSFSLPVEQIPILILFSVLPPAVLNFLIAEQFDQEPHLVASIVLVGNLASILTIPLVLWFIL